MLILGVLHSEYMNDKVYFEKNPDKVEGLTTPQELEEVYNTILEQAQQEGNFLILDPIKNKVLS